MKFILLIFITGCSALPTKWQERNRECHEFYLDRGLTTEGITKLCDRELRNDR